MVGRELGERGASQTHLACWALPGKVRVPDLPWNCGKKAASQLLQATLVSACDHGAPEQGRGAPETASTSQLRLPPGPTAELRTQRSIKGTPQATRDLGSAGFQPSQEGLDYRVM